MKQPTPRQVAERQAVIMSFYTVAEIVKGDVYQMQLDAWEEALTQLRAELNDNTDREERHSIAGGMNDPSPMQIKAFREKLWGDD